LKIGTSDKKLFKPNSSSLLIFITQASLCHLYSKLEALNSFFRLNQFGDLKEYLILPSSSYQIQTILLYQLEIVHDKIDKIH